IGRNLPSVWTASTRTDGLGSFARTSISTGTMSGKAWGSYLRSFSAACARLCSSGEVLTMSSSSGTRWLGSTGAGFFLPKRMPAWAGVARAAAVVTRARMLCHFIRWPPGCSQGLCDNTPPPRPLPEPERGSRRSFSPSPLRGGGGGEGFSRIVLRACRRPAFLACLADLLSRDTPFPLGDFRELVSLPRLTNPIDHGRPTARVNPRGNRSAPVAWPVTAVRLSQKGQAKGLILPELPT